MLKFGVCQLDHRDLRLEVMYQGLWTLGAEGAEALSGLTIAQMFWVVGLDRALVASQLHLSMLRFRY